MVTHQMPPSSDHARPVPLFPPVPLFVDDGDIEARIQEVFAARRSAATRARVRDLEELMAAQGQVADLQLQVADLTYQRDMARAELAAMTSDRNAWRALADWADDVMVHRDRYIATLHRRNRRLRSGRPYRVVRRLGYYLAGSAVRAAWLLTGAFLGILVVLVLITIRLLGGI